MKTIAPAIAVCLALASTGLAAPNNLANSAGIFLGPAYHFDLVRPGAALYGLAPGDDAPNPMKCTVKLEAEILDGPCLQRLPR